MKEYAAKAGPADANPLDSLGDVNYWFGRYGEAAENFTEAHRKSPGLLNGGDLYKAAWARWRAGDKKAAEDLFGQFLRFRAESKDAKLTVLHADWLYQTGHEAEAEQLLRKEAEASKEPAERLLFYSELAVWDLVAGKRDAAIADLRKTGGAATPTTLALSFAAMPTASTEEWTQRADRLFAPPQLRGLRNMALGWALILDGKKGAAATVWEKVVENSPGTDFFSRMVLTKAKGEMVKNLPPPDPRDTNHMAAALLRM
jgi:tetratricopeptide (TPR) repeat protein